MATLANILAGHFEIYWKAHVTGGSDPVTANAVDWTGWTQFGYQNEDGLKTSITAEILEAFVSDNNAPVKAELINEGVDVSFMLQESDLLHIGMSLSTFTYLVGAVPGTNPNLLTLGDKATLPFFSIGAEGVSKDGNEEVWVFHKCMAMGPAEWQGQKKDWRGTPFNWKLFNETGKTAGQRLLKAYEITSA